MNKHSHSSRYALDLLQQAAQVLRDFQQRTGRDLLVQELAELEVEVVTCRKSLATGLQQR